MTEYRKIEVLAYRSSDGRPTCCLEWGVHQCRMLTTRKFGCIDVCGITGADIDREDGNGYLRPVPGCLVWRDEVGK